MHGGFYVLYDENAELMEKDPSYRVDDEGFTRFG
jgi:hypothetical protein